MPQLIAGGVGGTEIVMGGNTHPHVPACAGGEPRLRN